MLQYSVPLPPLSLSSPPRKSKGNGPRPNDASIPPPPVSLPSSATLNNRRPSTDIFTPHSAFAFSNPHIASSINSHLSVSPASPHFSITTPLSPPVSLPSLSPAYPFRSKLPSETGGSTSRRSSTASSLMGDVLSAGDMVGEGVSLQGETIRLVSMPPIADDFETPAKEFEVVRRLGAGSYAVVYLVREVLSRPVPSADGHMSLDGMELDDKMSGRASVEYGRDFAIKCLSKANLDEEALQAQMTEVTIHQSLRSHPNIATLHRTLETSSFLLLLLEFVPGEDLFYFLEQARDHYDADSHPLELSSRTPPTPSLLSNLHPSQLLSRNRLRLIASMFSQMCEAVAACHDQHIFHRDIKPENFIVTDGWTTLPDGRRERKVVVKLTDFGLSTTDLESSDMDCGSAPYMSYECRNNVAPTYRPRAADVWSLGIVLINMLYHSNPWQDTSYGASNFFDIYRQQPVNFFVQRFTGMTRPVAEFLKDKVFCILEDPKDDSQRIEARDFGNWVKDLPALLADTSVSGHKRVLSTSSIGGFPIALSNPVSRRPSSRRASFSLHVPPSRSVSRAPSLGPAYENNADLSVVFDQDNEEQDDDVMNSRSTSVNKRRKRGARRGKGSVTPALPLSPGSPGFTVDDNLESLASASQLLAREISKTSRSASKPRMDLPMETPDLPPVPIVSVPPVVVKKTSKWKLSFGKNSSSVSAAPSPVDEVPPVEVVVTKPMSATASNVTNLIMGLNAPVATPSGLSQSRSPATDDSTWSRGRQRKATVSTAGPIIPPRRNSPPSMYNASAFLAPDHKWQNAPPPSMRAVSPRGKSPRAMSPGSTRSGRPVQSSASSVASNWRNSTSTTSSAGTSSSAFTRYSNNSARSVSTAATSVSASSWRQNQQAKPKTPQSPVSMYGSDNVPPVPQIPRNVKIMNGVPFVIDELPRGQYPNPSANSVFSTQPPPRKARMRKQKDQLGTISERPGMSPKEPTPIAETFEAMRSNTDLEEIIDEDGVPKKVQKGQINALAKILSAIRR